MKNAERDRCRDSSATGMADNVCAASAVEHGINDFDLLDVTQPLRRACCRSAQTFPLLIAETLREQLQNQLDHRRAGITPGNLADVGRWRIKVGIEKLERSVNAFAVAA